MSSPHRLVLAMLVAIMMLLAPAFAQAPQGALSGEYVGASGDVGFVVGGGANVLVGGSGRTVALQPLSLQGSLAFNVVLGVSSPAASAARARAMPWPMAATVSRENSPSFSSAAAIERGVGCTLMPAATPCFAVGPAAALASSLASMRACMASI